MSHQYGVQADRGARNPTTESEMFTTRRQPAPPAKTGLMSKVKTLLSSRKEWRRPHRRRRSPAGENGADPRQLERHQL